MDQQHELTDIGDLVGTRTAPESQPVVRRGHNGGGWPRYEPNERDLEKVRIWARVGTPQKVIAHELGISVETMVKHYGDEFDHALEKGVGAVAASLYQKALMGDNTAMIFFLKTRGRWRESGIGDEDNPLHIKANIDVSAIAQQMRMARIVQQPQIEGDSQ